MNGKLLFWIDETLYASPLQSLREAAPRIPAFTFLPFSPTWLLGVFPLRTDLVTLIDPRPFLESNAADQITYDTPPALQNKQALIIGDSGWPMAILVDRIGDIVDDDGERHDSQALVSETDGVWCDLNALFIDIVAELEAWARHV